MIAAGAFAWAAGSCAPDVAARVGDEVVLARQVSSEMGAVRANRAYVSYLERRTNGGALVDDQLGRGLVAGILSQDILMVAARAVARREGVSFSVSQLRTAREVAAREFGGNQVFNNFARSYRVELARREALLAALRLWATGSMDDETYYRSHLDEFVKPCTSDIVSRTEEEAKRVRRMVEEGLRFEDAARRFSIDLGTGPKGGDLGCNGPSDLVPELNEAVARQAVGKVGPPIKTRAGWHLILVRSRDTPSFSAVRGEVRLALEAFAQRRLFDVLHTELSRLGVWVAPSWGRWDPLYDRVVP